MTQRHPNSCAASLPQVPKDYSQDHCEPAPKGYEHKMEMSCRGPNGCYMWNSWCKVKVGFLTTTPYLSRVWVLSSSTSVSHRFCSLRVCKSHGQSSLRVILQKVWRYYKLNRATSRDNCCAAQAIRHAMGLFPETEYFLYIDSDATVGPEYAHISIAHYANHMERL